MHTTITARQSRSPTHVPDDGTDSNQPLPSPSPPCPMPPSAIHFDLVAAVVSRWGGGRCDHDPLSPPICLNMRLCKHGNAVFPHFWAFFLEPLLLRLQPIFWFVALCRLQEGSIWGAVRGICHEETRGHNVEIQAKP